MADGISGGENLKNICVRCKKTVGTGIKCVNCGTLSHKCCLKLLKNVKFLDNLNCICCSSDDHNKEESVAINDVSVTDKITIKYLEELIKQKEIIINTQEIAIKNQDIAIQCLNDQILHLKNITSNTSSLQLNLDVPTYSRAVEKSSSVCNKTDFSVTGKNSATNQKAITRETLSNAVLNTKSRQVCQDLINITRGKSQDEIPKHNARSLLKGSNGNTTECPFKAAFAYSNTERQYHATNFEPDVDLLELTNYLKIYAPNVIVEKLNSRQPTLYASFKVSVPANEADSILKSEIWPDNSKHLSVTVPVPSMKSSVNTGSHNINITETYNNPQQSNENTDVHAGPSSSTNEEKNINLKRKRNNSGQLQISSFVSRPLVLNRKECIDGKLVSLFTKRFHPFRLVEETAFKNVVNALNPNYELPSRHMISHTMIPAMYEKSVTAHYIDDNFVMKSVLLECSNTTDQHTSENLVKELQRIVSDWGVHDKILLAVLDNAANIKNAIDTKLKWKHLGCVAHTINLIVKDGLNCDETVTATIGKVKSIVAFFRRSTISNQKLLTYQKNQGNNNPLKLIQDTSTRWNSTYYMLTRFVQLEDAVKTTVALIIAKLSVLSQNEWQLIKELCQILKPFESVTKTFSGQSYETDLLLYPL
ncbi:unnamed protein product [Psylliodes chrysocephalus]|uniref:Uncharacterized protein n=1 Tax=Psylliodes chrysocephalus TaxID=3402493 RepID=A0A9P0GBZ9_9CUCU|nr:unnamed protein product [Psylliodes chrysocephala]